MQNRKSKMQQLETKIRLQQEKSLKHREKLKKQQERKAEALYFQSIRKSQKAEENHSKLVIEKKQRAQSQNYYVEKQYIKHQNRQK